MSDIAEASRSAQGLVYYYFKSKEDIYIELIRYAMDKLNLACIALEKDSSPPEEKVKQAIVELLKGFEQSADTAHYYLLTSQATISDAVPEKARKIMKVEGRKPYDVMSHIFAQGQKKGVFKEYDPEDMALVFWTSIKGLALHKAMHGRKFKIPDPELILRMFMDVKKGDLSESQGKDSENQKDLVRFPSTLTVSDERTRVTLGEKKKIIEQYFDGNVLTHFPKKQKKKLIVLHHIVGILDPNSTYSEADLNLKLVGIYEDFVTIRRYLIEYGFMQRKSDCSEYWVGK